MIVELLLLLLVMPLSIYSVGTCSEEICKPFVGGKTFQNCAPIDGTILRNGSEVSTTLVVDVASIKIQDWLTIQRRVYNGSLCGPTIRVRKGDTLRIRLINNLKQPNFEGEHNGLRLPSTTNIHLHGLHISSEEPGDSVFVRVDPESEYNYTYKINIEQPSGTYWYHAHWHGSTWFQVMSGLSGMFIVEDDPDKIPADDELSKPCSIPDNCYHDVEILLQSTLQYIKNADGVSFLGIQEAVQDCLRLERKKELWLQDNKNGIDYFTVNGLYMPNLKIEQNQLKRFRIANAGGFVGLELEVVKNGTSETACHIKEIAFDGVYLSEPRDLNFGQTFLTVGSRVDWLIYCNETGVYQLRSTPKNVNEDGIGQFRRYRGVLMTIEVIPISSNSPPSLPTSLPKLPSFLGDLRNAEVLDENKYTIEFAEDFFINREKFKNEPNFRYRMKLGTIQEWTLTNSILDAAHPLHIHVNHFQIISYNKYTGPYSKSVNKGASFALCSLEGNPCSETSESNSAVQCKNQIGVEHEKYWNTTQEGTLGYAEYGDWRDVLNLPPLSDVTVRFKAADYTGTVVIHCHVLKHEDLGMMMVVEVVESDASTEVENPTKLGCTQADSNFSIGARGSLKIQTAGIVIWTASLALFSLLY